MIKNILLLIFSLVFLTSCENKFEPPKTGLTSNEIPEQESWSSSVTFSDSGMVRAVLKAGHIAVYNRRAYTQIDSGAIVDFFKNGQKVSQLSGKQGKVLEPMKDIEIYDSVVFVNNEGSTLKTEKLLWNNKTQRVSSDKYVKIKTPKEEIEGIGFESDQSLKNYKIYKVTGTFSQ